MITLSPILILGATVIVALLLRLSNKLSPDVIALCATLVLGLSGVLTNAEMLAGSSSSAVITILGAFIMTHALAVTSVTRRLSKLLSRAGEHGEKRLVWAVMLSSAGLSLIMNKIVAVAVLLTATTEESSRAHVSHSQAMLPLAFATSLGGMMTLLNTGNLVVSAALKQEGLRGLLFSFQSATLSKQHVSDERCVV
jgi:Na+/H+ antiporter NhaD/arsenite permease-like protein